MEIEFPLFLRVEEFLDYASERGVDVEVVDPESGVQIKESILRIDESLKFGGFDYASKDAFFLDCFPLIERFADLPDEDALKLYAILNYAVQAVKSAVKEAESLEDLPVRNSARILFSTFSLLYEQSKEADLWSSFDSLLDFFNLKKVRQSFEAKRVDDRVVARAKEIVSENLTEMPFLDALKQDYPDLLGKFRDFLRLNAAEVMDADEFLVNVFVDALLSSPKEVSVDQCSRLFSVVPSLGEAFSADFSTRMFKELETIDVSDPKIRKNTALIKTLCNSLEAMAENFPIRFIRKLSTLMDMLDFDNAYFRISMLNSVYNLLLYLYGLEEKQERHNDLIKSLLSVLLERLMDSSSQVRARAIGLWTALYLKDMIPMNILSIILEGIGYRLNDKSVYVRKAAAKFFRTVVVHNKFGGNLRMEMYKEKLEKIQKAQPASPQDIKKLEAVKAYLEATIQFISICEVNIKKMENLILSVSSSIDVLDFVKTLVASAKASLPVSYTVFLHLLGSTEKTIRDAAVAALQEILLDVSNLEEILSKPKEAEEYMTESERKLVEFISKLSSRKKQVAAFLGFKLIDLYAGITTKRNIKNFSILIRELGSRKVIGKNILNFLLEYGTVASLRIAEHVALASPSSFGSSELRKLYVAFENNLDSPEVMEAVLSVFQAVFMGAGRRGGSLWKFLDGRVAPIVEACTRVLTSGGTSPSLVRLSEVLMAFIYAWTDVPELEAEKVLAAVSRTNNYFLILRLAGIVAVEEMAHIEEARREFFEKRKAENKASTKSQKLRLKDLERQETEVLEEITSSGIVTRGFFERVTRLILSILGSDKVSAPLKNEAIVALGRFMIVSKGHCVKYHHHLLDTLTESADPLQRVNALVILGDLFVKWPNVMDKEKNRLFSALRDPNLSVRAVAFDVLSRLILSSSIKARGQIVEFARMSQLDPSSEIRSSAREFFGQLSKRDRKMGLYNLVPDLVSALIRQKMDGVIQEQDFVKILKFILGFVSTDRQNVSLSLKALKRLEEIDPRKHSEIRLLLLYLSMLPMKEKTLEFLERKARVILPKIFSTRENFELFDEFFASSVKASKLSESEYFKGLSKTLEAELEQHLSIWKSKAPRAAGARDSDSIDDGSGSGGESLSDGGFGEEESGGSSEERVEDRGNDKEEEHDGDEEEEEEYGNVMREEDKEGEEDDGEEEGEPDSEEEEEHDGEEEEGYDSEEEEGYDSEEEEEHDGGEEEYNGEEEYDSEEAGYEESGSESEGDLDTDSQYQSSDVDDRDFSTGDYETGSDYTE